MEENIEELKARAEEGDAEALFELGFRYRFGQGVPEDKKIAAGYIKQASDLGDLEAMDWMGNFYCCGTGVDVDFAKAAEYFLPVAEAGSPLAQGQLGKIYMKGLGGEQDYEKAFYWLRKACDNEITHKVLTEKGTAANPLYIGCFWDLGYLYIKGWGVEKDWDEVMRIYDQIKEYGFETDS